MISRHFTWFRIRAALAGLLLISCFLPTETTERIASIPRGLIEGAVSQLTFPLKTIADGLRPSAKTSDDQNELDVLRRDYNALLSECNNMRLQLQRYERLESIIKFSAIPPATPVLANVAAWSGDAARPTLTLARGRNADIAAGMGVVSEDWTLIGRISSKAMGPFSSQVDLLLTPGRSIETTLLPANGATTSSTVRLYVNNDGSELVATVAKSVGIQPRWQAVLLDPEWPYEVQGYLVGQVIEVREPPKGVNPQLFVQVVVQPLRPPSKARSVFVLKPKTQ